MHLLLYAVGLALAAGLAGFLYQCIGACVDRRRYTRNGRWIKVGRACKLFLIEKGSRGPAVLFEAGIAATNLNWTRVQESVSQFACTAAYDRSGLGWSSPCRTARTPANIVEELHCLLHSAGIKPPYILVGHSFGGLVVRRYALRYPEDVSSVLLVDPMRCEEWPPLNPGKEKELERGRKLSRYAVPIARIGVARLAITSLLCRSGRVSGQLAGVAGGGARHVLSRVTEEVGKMPREIWPIIASHWSRPGYYHGLRSHVEAVPATVCEMKDAEPIRGIAVVVLTPGKSTPLTDAELSRIGDNVQQIIAPASAHWIHLDEPHLVVDAIRQMAAAAEGRVEAVTA